jgi:hypothetical protein
MRKSNIVAVFAVAAALALPATAQVGGVVVERAPGAVGVAQTIDVTATITAVDAASRAVRLKGPDGKEVSVIAGPEVKNFDQLQATYTEAAAISVTKQ